MSTENGARPTVEPGFELGGRFYPWHVSDTGKDIILIDRFGLDPDEFFGALDIEDEAERGEAMRAPYILAFVAISIRAANPTWSVERIVDLVMATPLHEITMISGTEEAEPVPPAPAGDVEAPASPSPPDESSRSSIPTESSDSETSYATPV